MIDGGEVPLSVTNVAVGLDVEGASNAAVIADVVRERAAHGIRRVDRGECAVVEDERTDALGIEDDAGHLAAVVDPEQLRPRQLGPAWRRRCGRGVDRCERALRVA